MSPFPFSNIEFFVVLAPTLLVILASKRIGPVGFAWTVVAASLGFFAWLPGLRNEYAGLFVTLTLMVWGAARAGARRQSAVFVKLAVCVIAVAFIVFRLDAVGLLPKRGSFGSLLPAFGFAFFVVKACGLLADVAAGRVKAVILREVVAYFAFFPTLIAGPIFRYDDFVAQLRAAPALGNDTGRVAAGIPRLLAGAFKVMVVAALIEPWSIQSFTPGLFTNTVPQIYTGSLAYYFFEYINFSGYSDMAVAVSRMIGLSPPENFDLPFLARNLTELWRRWHMSFASWLRDYVYFPLNFQLATRLRASNKQARTASAAAAIFLTFVFCGAWHGFTAGTMLFGTLSGLVLAFETMVTGFGWTTGIGARMQTTASGRLAHDLVRQIWTLHVASLTFAPVLLSQEQLIGVWQLLRAAI